MRLAVSILLILFGTWASAEKHYNSSATNFLEMLSLLRNANKDAVQARATEIQQDLERVEPKPVVTAGELTDSQKVETVRRVLTSDSFRKIYTHLRKNCQDHKITPTSELNETFLKMFFNYFNYENQMVSQEQEKKRSSSTITDENTNDLTEFEDFFDEKTRMKYFLEYLNANPHGFSASFRHNLFPELKTSGLWATWDHIKGNYWNYNIPIHLAGILMCTTWLIWDGVQDRRPPTNRLNEDVPRFVQPEKQFVDPNRDGQKIGEELFDKSRP